MSYPRCDVSMARTPSTKKWKAPKQRNWFAIWTTIIALVAVVGIGIATVVWNSAERAPAASPAAASVNQETGSITIGEGPNVIEEWVDFMYPYCGSFYESSGETVSEAVASGEARLELHPIAILDSASMGTQYSTRAASSVYCVAETAPDAVYPYVDLLFEERPREGTEGLTNEELVALAERAGATDVSECITAGTYADFVQEKTEETPVIPGNSGISTPTVRVNGDYIDVGGDPQVEIVGRFTA